MSSISVYAVPSAAQHRHRSQQRLALKRKRAGEDVSAVSAPQLLQPQDFDRDPDWSAEYTAVVTPLERVQRRLAGLPIDHDPPSLPFPHAPVRQERQLTGESLIDTDRSGRDHRAQTKHSLHAQHLAVMTALLHRCMMAKDYARAKRALGLLLRNEVGGKAIDVRSEGLWGMGAEILFRQGSATAADGRPGQPQQPCITREGFGHAKLYYERLMVQHPQHKTWPDAVNELDFGIALFNLWVHFVSHESIRLQTKQASADDDADDDTGSNYSDSRLLEAKLWELEQAKRVAEAMDGRMRNAPFTSNHEVTRLRAMVSLWIADIIGHLAQLEEIEVREQQSQDDGDEAAFLNQIERMVVDVPHVSERRFDLAEAASHREYAHILFKKLGTQH